VFEKSILDLMADSNSRLTFFKQPSNTLNLYLCWRSEGLTLYSKSNLLKLLLVFEKPGFLISVEVTQLKW
jgi:hypothetical protein